MPGLQFYIELSDSNPRVWRRIVVPYEYSFYKFHLAIQGAFGWENYHLFQFSENGFLDKVSYAEKKAEIDSDPELRVKDAKKSKIRQLFNQDQKKLIYLYDFGDSWEHSVLFFITHNFIFTLPLFHFSICLKPRNDCGVKGKMPQTCHVCTSCRLQMQQPGDFYKGRMNENV